MSDDARTDDELNAAFRRGAKAQQDICDSEHGDAAEVDRLRAELDRHRAAGDKVAHTLDLLIRTGEVGQREVRDALDGWRSVRGDAPAAPVFVVGDWVRVTGSVESSVGKILQRRHGAAPWGVLHDHDNRVRWWETSELAHESAAAPVGGPCAGNVPGCTRRRSHTPIAVAPPAAPTDGPTASDSKSKARRPHAAPTDGQAPAPLNGLTVEDVLDIVAPYLTGEASTCECPDSFRDNSVPVPYCLRHTVGPRVEAEVGQALRATAPADDTAVPAAPRADWSGAWAELTGYVRAATEPIDPAQIDAYMVELKREALRPFREWWKQLGAGQRVRDSQDGCA